MQKNPVFVKTARILGKWWILRILAALVTCPSRFTSLEANIQGEISPSILSARLRYLETHGLVARKLYHRRPYIEYSLTEKGRDIVPVLEAIKACGEYDITFFEDKWMLLILRELLAQPRRPKHLQDSIGISPAILSRRLRATEEDGFVNRKWFHEIPPRAEYSLTETGKQTRPVIEAFEVFGNRWAPKKEEK